jgi:hypothetical protein
LRILPVTARSEFPNRADGPLVPEHRRVADALDFDRLHRRMTPPHFDNGLARQKIRMLAAENE